MILRGNAYAIIFHIKKPIFIIILISYLDDWIYLIAAFAGGMFGAAVGAIPAFILTGLAAIISAAVAIITGQGDLVGAIAFGPLLGPHVSFAGGVAGAYIRGPGGLRGFGQTWFFGRQGPRFRLRLQQNHCRRGRFADRRRKVRAQWKAV